MLNQLVLPSPPAEPEPRCLSPPPFADLRLTAEDAVLVLEPLPTRLHELGEGDPRPTLAGHEDVLAVLLADWAIVTVCRNRVVTV
eukprot:12531553-Alexandrium_andersonii.AAC.1